MFVARKAWILNPYPHENSDWILNLVRLGESLGEKCFALLEGNEGNHRRTYLAFGEGWILSRRTFDRTPDPPSPDRNPANEIDPHKDADPLVHLRAFLKSHDPESKKELESGLIGYLDFEWGLKWQKPSASQATPDYFFRLSPINLVILPLSQKIVLEIFSENEEALAEIFQSWSSMLDPFLKSLTETKPRANGSNIVNHADAPKSSNHANSTFMSPGRENAPSPAPLPWSTNMSKPEFIRRVERIKEYVRAGDIFQAVPSQRFTKNVRLDPWAFYQKLRILNPSPYLFCVFAEKETLVGSSPELLISSVGSILHTRPIAGTRPRGKTPEEDLIYEKELLADPKEMAEHAMLVDLGRNDLGRVSQFGSVKVSQYAEIQRFSHVMHIVSTVEGQLDPSHDSLEALKSVFPAGTLSGAPKVRALEILQELEPEARGAYGGALGIVRWNGDIDFCITIRTLSIKEDYVQVQVGAGIVFDSIPEREYDETVHKAQALLKVVDDCVSRP